MCIFVIFMLSAPSCRNFEKIKVAREGFYFNVFYNVIVVLDKFYFK